MIGLLGKKVAMSQIFSENGKQIPITVIEVGPCYVTDVRTKEKDGYSGVQLAFDKMREKLVNKPKAGLFKKAKVNTMRFVREIRTENTEGLKPGTELKVDNFSIGDFVDIQGTSIGKGYQGVVKRHHFKGGEAAHGAKFGRESGSISQGSAYPSRVPKGRKMAGQMGNKTITTQNLKVLEVDVEKNLLAVHGSVPGYDGAYVIIKTALKKGTDKKWTLKNSESEKPAADAPKENKDAKSATKGEVKQEAKEPAKEAVKQEEKAKAIKEAPQPAAEKAPVKEKSPKDSEQKS